MEVNSTSYETINAWKNVTTTFCALALPVGEKRRIVSDAEASAWHCSPGVWIYPEDEHMLVFGSFGHCNVVRFDNLLDALHSNPGIWVDEESVLSLEKWRSHAKRCLNSGAYSEADDWLAAMRLALWCQLQNEYAEIGFKSSHGSQNRKDQIQKRAFQAWLRNSSREFKKLRDLQSVQKEEMGELAHEFLWCSSPTRDAVRKAYNEIRPNTLLPGR